MCCCFIDASVSVKFHGFSIHRHPVGQPSRRRAGLHRSDGGSGTNWIARKLGWRTPLLGAPPWERHSAPCLRRRSSKQSMCREQLSDRATCSSCVLWWINRNSHTGAESGLTHGPPHLLLQAVAQQALLYCYRVPDIRSFSIFFLTRWFVVINSHKSTCSTTLNSHNLTIQWYPTLAHLLKKEKIR